MVIDSKIRAELAVIDSLQENFDGTITMDELQEYKKSDPQQFDELDWKQFETTIKDAGGSIKYFTGFDLDQNGVADSDLPKFTDLTKKRRMQVAKNFNGEGLFDLKSTLKVVSEERIKVYKKLVRFGGPALLFPTEPREGKTEMRIEEVAGGSKVVLVDYVEASNATEFKNPELVLSLDGRLILDISLLDNFPNAQFWKEDAGVDEKKGNDGIYRYYNKDTGKEISLFEAYQRIQIKAFLSEKTYGRAQYPTIGGIVHYGKGRIKEIYGDIPAQVERQLLNEGLVPLSLAENPINPASFTETITIRINVYNSKTGKFELLTATFTPLDK